VTTITIALFIGTLSVLLSVALVPLVRQLARGGGLYEQPVADRWHRHPVPKLGGIAMAVAFVGISWHFADTTPVRALVLASAALCVLGLIDDFWPLRPAVKFSGQMLAAAVFLWFAPSIDLTGERAVDAALAFVWFVGITNAFNLLDNIDGAAAGIAAIAGTFLVAAIVLNGAPALVSLALVAAVMTGVALGFLVHNWHPASIFMGDSGSHLLGSFFAGAMVLAAPHMHEDSGVGIAIGVVLLFVPCADTMLVILTRQLAGRSAFVGGRDHLSHRIVALGLDERRAVLVLYGVAVTGGFVALGLQNLDPAFGWMPAALYGAGVAAVGVYLGHVDVHRPMDAARRRLPLPTELTSRYRVYEISFDLALVALAYYLGVLLRFHNSPDLPMFLRRSADVLPLIVLLHLAGLWIAGKYRAAPASRTPSEALTLIKGVAIGSAASVIAVLYITRFEGYSRQAFVMAAGLSLLFLSGGHFVLHAIDDLVRRRPANGPLALVYGAGHRCALVIREVMSHTGPAFTPIGVLDDDPARHGDRLEGVRILGGVDELDALLAREPVSAIIVSTRSLPPERFDRLCAICEQHGVEVRQFRASFEDVDVARTERHAGVLRFPRT
jgi:UDP-GlcNAc:undecaprenyl-phosphate GlcNAc-1-phosphate transferase